MSKKDVAYKQFPETPGVYIMKNAAGEILYVGKAGNLRRRVSSYFMQAYDSRIERLVGEIAKIDHKRTDTAIEALILEAELIKKLEPPYNIREKDDKSFLYVEITKDEFPRVLLVRGKDILRREKRLALSEHKRVEGFGPFTSASSIREALRIIRRIFPFSTHEPDRIGKFLRPCFDYEIGLCPGTCIGAIRQSEYAKTIRHIRLFFEGKKEKILAELENDMRRASNALEFEKAENIRRQVFALRHIQDVALITDDSLYSKSYILNSCPHRIEGYDISNISGTSAVGAMVVFENGRPNKSEYRKFKIRSIHKPDDVHMLEEMLRRRFSRNISPHSGDPNKKKWPLPELILIDGGIGQVNIAKKVLREFRLHIPIVGIAKGEKRKRNDIMGQIPEGIDAGILMRVRDEAHRFAIRYHKTLRTKRFMS